MKMLELVVAGVLAVIGVRTAVKVAREPFPARDLTDHFLYALHLTGRVGLWFAFALVFLMFGTSDAQGRAFADEMRDQRWVLFLIVALAAMQFLGGWFLGRRLEPPTGPDGP